MMPRANGAQKAHGFKLGCYQQSVKIPLLLTPDLFKLADSTTDG